MNADTERGRRLFEQVKHLRFWCEVCNGVHPLIEHRDCRMQAMTAIAARARRAITKEDTYG